MNITILTNTADITIIEDDDDDDEDERDDAADDDDAGDDDYVVEMLALAVVLVEITLTVSVWDFLLVMYIANTHGTRRTINCVWP